MHLLSARCLTLLALLALSACGGGGNSTPPTPPPTPPPPAAFTAQVLLNAGFEDAAPLAWQGDTGIIGPAQAGATKAIPHAGTQFAWLIGNTSASTEQIYQDLSIPATAQSATVDFYLKVVTSQTGTTPIDTFTVSALDTSGNLLTSGLLLTKSNTDALSPAAYAPFSVNLLPFKGQVVRLSFKGVQAGTTATSFLLDDVTANIGVPTAADFKPIITGFTPSSGLAGETSVQVTGKNFFGMTNLTIGGASATFTLTDGTSLSAPLPATAALGAAPLSLTNAQGTVASASNFTVGFGAPAITGMNPTQGPVGTPVVITGAYLGYPGTTVTLNGTAITPIAATSSQISFTIPASATSGNVVVTTPSGPAAPRTFTVNAASSTLDLHIERLQFTQSTQTPTNSVPIVAGKDGLVRVFVLANKANTAAPEVQITLLNGGVVVPGYLKKPIPRPSASVPLAMDESTLASSWNLFIPGTDLTTPAGAGYTIQAVVDPTSSIPEADVTNNQASVTFTGKVVPTFKTMIFPVVLASGTGNITETNKLEWVARLAKMYPLASVEVTVGAAFTGSVNSLVFDDADKNWGTLLADLRTKHLGDATSHDRYYYGALNVSYGTGIAGLGYVPKSASESPASYADFSQRTAIGWDKASGYKDGGHFPEVFAHETGHNMGRNHSPCSSGTNVPKDTDPAYPYVGGTIGVWGYDSVLNTLHSPLVDKDIMGYCSPNWVSDYVYTKVLDFRGGTGGFLILGAEDAPLVKEAPSVARECLIVRGIVSENGKVDLLPSFRTQALPSTLPSTGEFSLECQNAQGLTTFSTPLELTEVGCSPNEHSYHFVMALSLTPATLNSLAGLKVLKGGQIQASRRSVAANANARIVTSAPEARRITQDQMQLAWDASIHPSVLVRDADTGEIIAILAGGRQTIATKGRRFDLVLSDGVTGPTHRLEAAQ